MHSPKQAQQTHPRRRLKVIAAACVLAWTATALPVHAQQASTGLNSVQTYSLAAQPLGQALNDLARQAGVAITVDAALVAGKKASAVSGSMTAKQALERLLAGSGLVASHGDGAVVIKPAPMAKAEREVTLPAVMVSGEKIGRTLRETPASTVYLDGEVASAPKNKTWADAIQGIPNVVADEGVLLPAVRGIDGLAGFNGGSNITTGAQPRVNILTDGVPSAVTLGPYDRGSVWDLESVEVAKGPQSTISGRNSLGGVIRINTKDPVYAKEFAVRGEYFNQDGTFSGAAMANVPLVAGEAAARFTVEKQAGKSFVDVQDPFYAGREGDIEETNYQRLRGKLLITPKSLQNLELLLSVDQRQSEQMGLLGGVDNKSSLVSTNLIATGSEPVENKVTTYSVRGRYYASDNVTVESNLALSQNNFRLPGATSKAYDVDWDSDSVLFESFLRYSGKGLIKKGLVGFSYESFDEDVPQSAAVIAFGLNGEIETYGLFGELELGLSDQWTLLAGARYEKDERSRSVDVNLYSGWVTYDVSQTLKENELIPSIGLRYEPTANDTYIYSYRKGYRPGGLSVDFWSGTFATNQLKPESMWQHELSYKKTALNGRFTLDSSIFHWTFDDQQVYDSANFITVNVPKTRGYGMELAGSFQLTPHWKLSGGLGLLKTRLVDGGAAFAAFEGEELSRSPNITANAAIEYRSSDGVGTTLGMRHVGDQTDGLGRAAGGNELDSYTVVDFSVHKDFKLANGAEAQVQAYVTNLLDERYETQSFGGTAALVGHPRTLGVAVTAKF